MALGNADELDFMLQGAGVPVVYDRVLGGVIVETTGYGVLSIDDVQMISMDGGTITGRKYRLTVSAKTFAAVSEGTSVKVDGTTYRVTQKWLKSDGKIADLYLSTV